MNSNEKKIVEEFFILLNPIMGFLKELGYKELEEQNLKKLALLLNQFSNTPSDKEAEIILQEIVKLLLPHRAHYFP